MCTDEPDGHMERAKEYRDNEDFERAGEHFTATAYEEFGVPRPEQYCQHQSRGLYNLLHAAVCYRLAGLDRRCRLRCERGILTCKEMKARVMELPTPENAYDRTRRGAWDEFIGDFRVIARQDGAESAYEQAQSIYNTAGECQLGFAEWEHLHLTWFFEHLASGAGVSLDTWYEQRLDLTFSEWVDYKRRHLPEYYDRLTEAGTWD